MTVQTSTAVATGIGNGVTTNFPVGFKFNRDEDLFVILIDTATEEVEQLALNSDYTVQGAGNEEGGSVITLVPVPLGKSIRTFRIVDLLQLTDLRNQGKFFAEIHEDTFDLIVMMVQQQQEQLDRAVKVPPSSDTPPEDLFEEFKADIKEANVAAESAAESAEEAKEIADKFGNVDSAISAAEKARDDASIWADQAAQSEANAESAADRAEDASDSAAIASGTYNDVSELQTAINNGDIADEGYARVRSASSDAVVDEYQNVLGQAVYTGKSYPSTRYFNNVLRTSSMALVSLSPRSGYAVAFIGGGGLAPLAVRLDGTVVQPKAEIDVINDVRMGRLNPRSGYVFGVEGSDFAPWAIREDGTVVQPRIEVETINGHPWVRPGDSMHIPQSIQEWWIQPVHTQLSRPYERIVSGVYGEGGEIIVAESVPGRGTIKRVVIGSTPVIDDHNCPALWAEEGRRMVAVWTRHGVDTALRLRVSNAAGDLESFLEHDEVLIGSFGGGGITYSQVYKIRHLSDAAQDTLWVFLRISGFQWGVLSISVDQQTGAVTRNWSTRIFESMATQAYTISADTFGPQQIFRFAVGFNPAAERSEVWYGELNAETGQLVFPDAGIDANFLDPGFTPVDLDVATPSLPQPAEGVGRRLLYVRPGPISPAILIAEWPLDDRAAARYYVCTPDGAGGWNRRDHGPSGSRVGYVAGANYIAGGSFPTPCYSDVVYIARHDDDTNHSYLEEHRTIGGDTVQRILHSIEGARITRPWSPNNGSSHITFSHVTWYADAAFTFNATVESVRLEAGL